MICGIKSACALQLCEQCGKYKPKTPHHDHKGHRPLLTSPLIILKTWTLPFEMSIYICVCVCYWHSSCCGSSLGVWLFLAQPPPPPQWARASLFTKFLDHKQRRTTVGRSPLDEWSARRRDLYLTTHNAQNRQTSMPPVGFEPTILAGERQQTYALDRAATGTGHV
jgi:hypothetical protein